MLSDKLHIGRLIFGVVFVVIGIYGVTDAEPDAGWIWVAVFAAGGLAGLATAIRNLLNRDDR